MGYPSDEKSPDGLPTHTAVPFGVPPGGASIWAETPRERSRRRCGIVGKHIAVLLAAFFGLLYAHKTFKVFAHFKYSDKDYFAEENFFDEAYRPYPIKCVKWSNEAVQENSKFTYSFPINSASFFISRGPLVGAVDYVLADEGTSKDFINVSLTLSEKNGFNGSPLRKKSKWLPSWIPHKWVEAKKPRAEVCLLKDHYCKEPTGFAVYVPHRRPRGHWGWPKRYSQPSCHDLKRHPVYDEIYLKNILSTSHGYHEGMKHGHHGGKFGRGKRFPIVHAQMTITIPRDAISIPAFHSDFPAMDHNIGKVFDNVEFGNFTVVGKRVNIDTVTAGHATLITNSNNPINGSYTVYDKLSIVAKNAPVTANVKLFSASGAHKPTSLSIINDHATITSTVALLLNSTSKPDHSASNNGSFSISAVTSEAEIKTNVTVQPIESSLKFSAVTKNANIGASLPPPFEGRLSLVSSRTGESAVEFDKDTPDPTGAGRTRYVDVKTIFGSIIIGYVGWRESDATNTYVHSEQIAAADAVSTVEASEYLEETVENLIGGWELIDAMDESSVITNDLAIEHDMEREAGSTISLVTSAATNYLYFA